MTDLLTPIEQDTPLSADKRTRVRQMRSAVRTQMRLPEGAVCACGQPASEMDHGEPSFRWLAKDFWLRHRGKGTLAWRAFHMEHARPRPVCTACHARETRKERRVRAKVSRRMIVNAMMLEKGCSRQQAVAWLDKRVRT